MTNHSKPHKPYSQMTTAELREATRAYDREELGLLGKPLTAAQRKAFRATGKRGLDSFNGMTHDSRPGEAGRIIFDMSVSTILFAALNGSLAARALDLLDSAPRQRVDPQQATPAARQSIVRLLRQIDDDPTAAGIVFYRKYVDPWSMRGFLLDTAFTPAEQRHSIDLPSPTVLWLPRRRAGAVAARADHLLRLRRVKDEAELRWFCECVRDACEAARTAGDGVVLLAIDVRGVEPGACAANSGARRYSVTLKARNQRSSPVVGRRSRQRQ
jgi:hypothetical protein